MKKVKTFKIILIVVILLSVVGITYGFFASQIVSGAFSNILVGTSSTDSFTFSKGNNINIVANQQNFALNAGNLEGSSTVSAKLIANNDTKTASKYYSVSLDITKNGYIYTSGSTPELMMTVTDPSGAALTAIDGLNYTTSGGVTGFDITTKKEKIIIKNNKQIVSNNYTTGLIENWIVKVYFINLNTDQQGNTGKEFISSLNIYSSEKKVNNGTNNVTLANSNGGYLKDYRIYGNSVQNGTPTPSAPVPINNLGKKDNINITTIGKNLFNIGTIDDYFQGVNYFQILSNKIIGKNIQSSSAFITNKKFFTYETNMNYTFSFDSKSNTRLYVSLYDENKNNISSTINIPNLTYNKYYGSGALFLIGNKLSFSTSNQNVKFFRLGFSTYDTAIPWNSDIILENIQLEEGSVSSSYEPYKENVTSISLAGHEPLRKVGDIGDYIDFENNRIVRNIGKIEFVGTESWLNYVPYNGGLKTTFSLQAEISNITLAFGIPFLTTHLPFIQSIWSASINDEGVGKSSNGAIYLKVKRNLLNVTLPGNYDTQQVDTSNVVANGWKEWLKGQKNANKPFVVYYQLENPIYEQIKLSNIKIFEGNNKITISDGTMNPSKIEVSYFS